MNHFKIFVFLIRAAVLIALVAVMLTSCRPARYATFVQLSKVQSIDTLSNGMVKVNIRPIQPSTPLQRSTLQTGDTLHFLTLKKL